MPTSQSAIFRLGLRAHEHLEFDLRPQATADAIRAACATLANGLGVQALVVGFSDRLWRLLAPGDQVPAHLAALAPIRGSAGLMPVHQHDLWLWLQDSGPDLNLDGARRAISFSSSKETCRCRSARSARTPSRISSSTLTRFARPLTSVLLRHRS